MLANHTNSPLYDSREETSSEDPKGHYLFLLELLVKQASGDRLAKLNQMFSVPTIVQFGFLDFIDENDLEVTPVNLLFQPQAGVANDVEVFNVGKSVLFALDHDAVLDNTLKMILKIIVKKQMPDNMPNGIMPNGTMPDVLVGIGELDLSDQYVDLRMEMLQYLGETCKVATSKVFDGQVPLIHNEELSGNLDIFVRLSGFGQTIVTEIDAPVTQCPSTFVFGTREMNRDLSYKCHKIDSRSIDFFEDSSEDLQNRVNCSTCAPEKCSCVLYGKLASVEERGVRMKDKCDDGIAKRRSRDMPCGKPVILKVSGLFDNGDGGKKPTVMVTAHDSDAMKPDDTSSDPDHDIFILRIGKKGLVGVGEKSDIQLEMKTPKGSERRPPIRYETRDMQTDIGEELQLKDKKDKKQKKKTTKTKK